MKNPKIKPNRELWLIWSTEHSAWWRPSHRGYTPVRAEAGLYEMEDALKIVKGANIGLRDVPNESMVQATRDEVQAYEKRLTGFGNGPMF